MRDNKPKNLAASIRQRLFNRATERKEDFNLVLTKFALERLMYRLSISPRCQDFVLKGALLFELWTDKPYRPTRDADFAGRGAPDVRQYEDLFRELCDFKVTDPDGLTFDRKSVHGERIREEESYEGVRLHLVAHLAEARIPLQVDIAFGDAITPAPIEIAYPTLLDLPAPKLAAYPQESVVSEKFEAIVKLGIANSRMKDFYDIYALAQMFEFDGPLLSKAIRATFATRQTAVPKTPVAFTPEFSSDPSKVAQWRGFLRRAGIEPSLSLEEVVTLLKGFLLPPAHAAQSGETSRMHWRPGGPWRAI